MEWYRQHGEHGSHGGRRSQGAGAEAVLLTAAEFGPDQMDAYDAIAFGCPSMGAEQLEESEFEPMFSACEANCRGRRSACSVPTAGRRRMDAHLEETCRGDGANLVSEGVICNEAPDDEAEAACQALGKALA